MTFTHFADNVQLSFKFLTNMHTNRSEDWHDVDIPIHEFLLSWRGKLVEHKIEMNTGMIQGLGISYSGRHLPGATSDFSLDLSRISGRRSI